MARRVRPDHPADDSGGASRPPPSINQPRHGRACAPRSRRAVPRLPVRRGPPGPASVPQRARSRPSSIAAAARPTPTTRDDARCRPLAAPRPGLAGPAGTQHLVEEVRERVITAAAYRPFEGEHRVFVIEAADAMADESQNALLKTLEEPAPIRPPDPDQPRARGAAGDGSLPLPPGRLRSPTHPRHRSCPPRCRRSRRDRHRRAPLGRRPRPRPLPTLRLRRSHSEPKHWSWGRQSGPQGSPGGSCSKQPRPPAPTPKPRPAKHSH